MSLIRSKLEKVVERADGSLIARCPACAAIGRDRTGNHLKVAPDGRFACVVFPGDAPESKKHRSEIYRLAGDGRSSGPRAAWMDGPEGWQGATLTITPWRERYPRPRP